MLRLLRKFKNAGLNKNNKTLISLLHITFNTNNEIKNNIYIKCFSYCWFARITSNVNNIFTLIIVNLRLNKLLMRYI